MLHKVEYTVKILLSKSLCFDHNRLKHRLIFHMLLFSKYMKLCVATNGAMCFGCVVPFGTTHFLFQGGKDNEKSISVNHGSGISAVTRGVR